MGLALLFPLNLLDTTSTGSVSSVAVVDVKKAIPPLLKPTNTNLNTWYGQVHQYSYDFRVLNITMNPSSVAANTTAEQNFSVTGLYADDIVINLIKPSLDAGLGIANVRISADEVLTVTFVNSTAGAIDAGEETYKLVYLKNTAK